MDILKKLKNNQRGSITVFVLATMIIVIGIIVTIYMATINKNNSQITQLNKIQEEYMQTSDNSAMDQAYNETLITGKTDGSWNEEKGVNTPVIKDNMELVKWNGSQFVSDDTKLSYSYDGTTNEWANAKVTIDGVESYFVWIPRYAYKITYKNPSNKSEGGTIDVKFLIGTTDQYYDDDGELKTAKRAVTGHEDTTADYYVHPAFMNDSTNNYENGGWSTELPGIWVGKYETSLVNKETQENIITTQYGDTTGNILLSDNANKTIAVQPGMNSWRWCTIGNMYTNAKAYSTNLNSHMLKNSEWGAVAYLTESKYGRNGIEITINNSNITGSAKTSSGTTRNYASEEGVLASSTGNVYGIYDLLGGATEYVTAYYKDYDSSVIYGESFTNRISDQYSTTYPNTLSSSTYKLGDATYETSGWHGDKSEYVYYTAPFISRGGYYGDGDYAGLFSFAYGNGCDHQDHGFRMCLALD